MTLPTLPDEANVETYMPGFWQDTPEGRIFVVDRRFALTHRHGGIPLGRVLRLPPAAWTRLARDERLAQVPAGRVLYVDIETTGRLHGAETYPFMIGVGHFVDGGFRLRQYFQTAEGQESALLRAFVDFLAGFDAVVTFNGKAFDLPLLEARLALHGLLAGGGHRPATQRLIHVDLLPPARRVYRDRFRSCRLAELEQHVLGLQRVEDVPSAAVPGLYVRYARYRRFRAVQPIFQHNALDVLSLVTLAAHLGGLFTGVPPASGQDCFALGRAHEADGLPEEAIASYSAALRTGLGAALQHECERRLSRLWQRSGELDAAAALWEAVIQRPRNRQLHPYLELAKYHERVSRDFERALALSRRALELIDERHLRYGAVDQADRSVLVRRIARLERRAASPSGPPGRRVRRGVASAG